MQAVCWLAAVNPSTWACVLRNSEWAWQVTNGVDVALCTGNVASLKVVPDT